MQRRETSQGPVTQKTTQEQKKRINRISAAKPQFADEQIRYGRDLDEDESRQHTRGDAAGQTASSLPRIISPREGRAIDNLENYAQAPSINLRGHATNSGLRQSVHIGRSGSMPSQMVISARHDPKGTGVPQTQVVTKTKAKLPKGQPKSFRMDGTVSKGSTLTKGFNNTKTQFPDIFRDRQPSSEVLNLKVNVRKGGSVPRPDVTE